jgi:CheY-like chemotaxis protein/nitrogen-specific signal transduction histidine kinase
MPSKKRQPRSLATLPARKTTKRAAKRPKLKKRISPAKRNRGGGARVIEVALAAFAHEVRTPLTGILAIGTLLETSDLPERERRWVETIKASAEHLSALTTLFVDAARSGGPGLVIREDVFDLRALAQAAAASLSGRATAKGLPASTAVDAALPAFAVGDAVRLRAALENLIDNAVKFSDRGRIAFEAALIPAPKSRGKIAVAFTLADSGIGLAPADINKLFKPFTQANIDIAQRFGGAGLGLSSVRQLARAMGGDVTAKPRRGGGTIFTLTAMLRRADGISSRPVPRGHQQHTVSRALKILSVEDNPFGRVVLNAILHELGHQAEFIGRGEDAIDRLSQGGFDAVLMDMVLPGIGGIEAIARIRASEQGSRHVAIIGISGRDSDESGALVAGADAFLLKPVSPRALAVALANAVRSGTR